MKKLLSKKVEASADTRNGEAAYSTDKSANFHLNAHLETNAVKAFGENILRYRFAISCIALLVLVAIVVATVLGGSGAASTALAEGSAVTVDVAAMGEPTNAAFYETPTPEPSLIPTVEPTAVPTAEPTLEPPETNLNGQFKLDEGFGFPEIETSEPYVEITTEVPDILPVPVADEKKISVTYGEHSELIPAVQERLMVLWYMDQDEPTDYFGRVTRSAIEAFQRRSELPVTGEIDTATYNALFDVSARAYLCSVGDEGADVDDIQSRLHELGYLNEKSGVFDEATLKAVTDFQSANDLYADGKVGRGTKEALYDPECAPKAWSLGDSGDKVLACQQRLKELGYLTTTPDGVYGKDTQNAVRRFQSQNQLIEDGYLGPVTREKLMSDDALPNTLSYAMQGADVLSVQTRLAELNYMRAQDVNSYYTSITEAAVKLFQKNNDLKEDGKVGRNTLNALMSSSAVRAKSPVTNEKSAQSSSSSSAPAASTSSGSNNSASTASSSKTSGSSNTGSSSSGSSNSGSGNSGSSNSGSSNTGNSSSGNTNSGSGNSGSVDAKINKFLSVARSKLGCRYVRGGKGSSVFDCSGFVYWVLNHSGVSQGYMTSYMWRSCKRYQRNNNINNVKKGDIIVYYGHVAICSGNWTQIDASQSKGKVVERSFNSSYWHRNFICSFRIFT